MKDVDQLKVADELLVLEKGQEELLLANPVDFRPLYIRKGREFIKQFLRAAGELGSYKSITKAYPQERSLLELLLEYRIVVPRAIAGQGKPGGNFPKGPPPGKKTTISLYLLLSQSCNMRCVYCLDGSRTYQTDKNLRMSKEVAFKSIERCLDELDASGRLEVIFFGGEPLLNWPLAKETIIHCEKCLHGEHKRKTRRYCIASNLTIFPADLIEWARKYEISFLCDIDGPSQIHDLSRPFRDGRGTYETSARSIRLLRAAGLKINLRATVTALNQDYLLEIAKHHKAIGGQSSAFCPVFAVNTDGSVLPQQLLPSPEKIIQGMTRVYRSKLWQEWQLYPFNMYAPRLTSGSLTVLGCGAPCGTVPAVAANGDVYPCTYLVGHQKFHLGNILDPNYPKREVLERMLDDAHVDRREDCRQCPWRYLCGGGCLVERLTVNDNSIAASGVKTYCEKISCDYAKKMLELLLWEKATTTASTCAEDAALGPKCV